MSCVPSINAYVAAHTCPHDDPCRSDVKSSCSKLPETQEKRSSWLSSFVGKFTLLGHDGIFVGQEQAPESPNLSRSSSLDLPPEDHVHVLSSIRSSSMDTPAIEQTDILSRIRHLSGASNDGSSSSLTSSSTSNKNMNKCVPER